MNPLLAGESAICNQAPTSIPFGVASVLLNIIKHINNVRPLKYKFAGLFLELSKHSVLGDGLTRAWYISEISVIAAHHGPSPAFQTMLLNRTCPGSILKDSRHPGGGQKACFWGFQKCTMFAQQTGPRTKSFRGKFFTPFFFALMGMVYPIPIYE